MFKKTERLNRLEFTEYSKAGKKHHFEHFTIITHSSPTIKVAVVVGKRVAKLAVKRNLIKRRIYGLLKKYLQDKDVKQTIIVLVKPSYNTLPRKTANKVLEASLDKIIN